MKTFSHIFSILIYIVIFKESFADVNFRIKVDDDLNDDYYYKVKTKQSTFKKGVFPSEYYMEYQDGYVTIEMKTATGFTDDTFSCNGEFTISLWLSLPDISKKTTILSMEGLDILYNHLSKAVEVICRPFSNNTEYFAELKVEKFDVWQYWTLIYKSEGKFYLYKNLNDETSSVSRNGVGKSVYNDVFSIGFQFTGKIDDILFQTKALSMTDLLIHKQDSTYLKPTILGNDCLKTNYNIFFDNKKETCTKILNNILNISPQIRSKNLELFILSKKNEFEPKIFVQSGSDSIYKICKNSVKKFEEDYKFEKYLCNCLTSNCTVLLETEKLIEICEINF